jgi:NTP pyrophosphatase (non-canonical NTP hydrolase)
MSFHESKLGDYQHDSQRWAGFRRELRNAKSFKHKMCGALGLAGEAGEVADYIKKVHFHEHDFDEAKLKDELGDVLFYLAMMCEAHGFRLEDVAAANLAKLRSRYPNGFSAKASRERVR